MGVSILINLGLICIFATVLFLFWSNFDEVPKQKRLVVLYWITLGVLCRWLDGWCTTREKNINVIFSKVSTILNSGLIQLTATVGDNKKIVKYATQTLPVWYKIDSLYPSYRIQKKWIMIILNEIKINFQFSSWYPAE